MLRIAFLVVSLVSALLIGNATDSPAQEAQPCSTANEPQDFPAPALFYPVRPRGVSGTFRPRDLEFQWDALYDRPAIQGDGLSETDLLTLEQLGITIADRRGENPFGADLTDIQLVYEYFRSDTTAAYNINPLAPYGIAIGFSVNKNCAGTPCAQAGAQAVDRGHVDHYLYLPGHNNQRYNTYPSQFYTAKEDSATIGRWLSDDDWVAWGGNTIMTNGPADPSDASRTDLDGTGWTRPGGGANVGFCHEFQHSLTKVAIVSSGWDELFGVAAEAIAGNPLPPSNYDVSYVHGLGWTGQQQHKWMFACYLAYNFRGIDTSPTLTGFEDDRLYRWAKGDHHLFALAALLSDENCAECSPTLKPYFHPPGVSLSGHDRLQLLIHNWRVANFVNNSSLADHQYGYPPQFGFTPKDNAGAWQSRDADGPNDVYAIPPEVRVGPSMAVRETSIVGVRHSAAGSLEMKLHPFGSEYWVVRADPALGTTPRDLVVRVSPEGIYRCVVQPGGDPPPPTFVSDLRLMASVVGYSVPADFLADGQLWAHPEWAVQALDPIWVDVDSLAGGLDGPRGLRYDRECRGRGDFARRRTEWGMVADKSSQWLACPPSLPTESLAPWCESESPRTSGRREQDRRIACLVAGRQRDRLLATRPHERVVGHLPEVVGRQPRGAAWHCNRRESIRAGLVPARRLDRVHSGSFRQVRRSNLDGSGDILLAEFTPSADAGPLRWAPDGRFLYLARNGTLDAVPADGGTLIPRPALLTGANSFDLHRGVGPLLAEQAGVLNPSGCTGPQPPFPQPFIRIATSDTTVNDTQARFYRTGAQYYQPRWSPDGPRIAYSSDLNTANDPGSVDRDLFIGQVSYNHAPQLAPLPDQVIPAGPTFVLEVQAYDPDGEALTFDAPSRYLPPGASFDPGTHRLTWTNPGPPMSEHFMVFRVMDGSGGVASRAVRIAVTAPAIADLNLDIVGSDMVWLSWTAPGASGGPSAVEYDLRYAPYAITEGNFDYSPRAWDAPAPAAPGTIQTHMIGGLLACTPYWFAIKSKDAGGNWSPISNVPSATTMCGGGGGGGETSARPVGPTLAGADAGRAEPAFARPGGGDSTQVALAVEMAGTALAPDWTIHHLPAEEQAELVGEGFTGVVLQAPDAGGSWRERGRLALSGTGGRLGLRALRRPARLIFLGAYDLQQTWNVVAPGAANGTRALALTAARHSRLGDLTGALVATAGYDAGVGEDDTLALHYEPTLEAIESAPPWFMVVGPAGSSGDLMGFRGRGVGQGEALPTAFALRQNRPNPFSGTTEIRFELPVETPVRLAVFDAQGRVVRTLADGSFPVGFHSVVWDERDASGTRVRPGIYFYRIVAGAFRAQRKMTLL